MRAPRWIHGERGVSERFAPNDETEAVRTRRLRDPAAAQDLLHARMLMRRLVAQDRAIDPSGVSLQAYDNAPPRAQGFDNMGISWARSGRHAIAARLDNGRVGADLEQLVPRQVSALLGMIATPAERALLEALGGSEAAALPAFYRLWCTKEAVLKWRGTGLRGGARHVEVPASIIDGTVSEAGMEAAGTRLHVQVIQPGGDWLAVLAFSD